MNTSQSEALFVQAQRLLPGGVNSPVRAFRSVGGTPRFIAAARVCRVGMSTAMSTSTTSARGGR